MRPRTMRIFSKPCWLVAIALVPGIANGEGDSVRFNDYSFANPAIYRVQAGGASSQQNFTWTSQNVPVEEIKIYTYDPHVQDSDEEIGSQKPVVLEELHKPGEFDSSPSPASLQPVVQIANEQAESSEGISRRQGHQLRTAPGARFSNFTVVQSNNSGEITIDLLAFLNTLQGVYKGGYPLYFVALWGSHKGCSYSRRFAVVQVGEEIQDVEELRLNAMFGNTTAYRSEEKPDGIGSQNPGPSTSTPPNDGSIGSNPPKNAGSASSSGGLAKGAVVGIAVAASIVGLAAVLALVWFVVRRQKRKQQGLHPAGVYSSGNHGDELIAEKEARAGADVTTTPQSPYSDDGHGAGDAARTAASVTTPTTYTQDPTQTFISYNDRGSATPRQNSEAGVSAPSPIPGRATPRGLSTPYAHLVEEGMTEDDVRRLEEEERQLDAAIEQAGRR